MTCGTIGASADNTTLAFFEETVFGTTPTGNPALEQIRYLSESLAPTTGTVTSAEITGARRVPDIVRSAVGSGGDINFEMSYQSAAVGTSQAMDLLWEGALQSADWTTQIQLTVSATFGTGPETITDAAADFVAAGFVVNQIIKVQAASNAANNSFCKIVTVATTVLTVTVLNSTGTFTVEGPTASVVVTQGPYITDGNECRAYSFEREYTDLTTTFELHNGVVMGGFGLTIPLEGIVTGAFTSNLGAGAASPSPTATFGDGSNVSAEANDVMGSVDNVLIFTENNAEFAITSFGLTATNNLRPRRQVGSASTVSIGSGRMEMTGTLQAFFANSTFFDRYLAFTETNVTFVLQDTATNAYVIDIPALKFTAGQRVSGGINTDIIQDMSWGAKTSATENIVFRMARFDADDT